MRSYLLTTETVLQEPAYATLTHRMTEERVTGKVDGIKALEQAIYNILNTERYEYPIYSFAYGVELNKLIGKEQPYVRSELKRIIREALLQDDRILQVDGFQFEFEGDICRCSFNVSNIYGPLKIKVEGDAYVIDEEIQMPSSGH